MRHFKLLIIAASLFVAFSASMHAAAITSQPESEKEHRGEGYLFFAPGGLFSQGHPVGTAHFGGGGEFMLFKGLGAGAEIGYLTPWEDFSAGIGVLSANGAYHFLRNRKVSPFLTGGYSLAFRDGHANLVNFGGGVNWWVKEGVGLRLEFRDHMHTLSYYNNSIRTHYLGGRIGLSFR